MINNSFRKRLKYKHTDYKFKPFIIKPNQEFLKDANNNNLKPGDVIKLTKSFMILADGNIKFFSPESKFIFLGLLKSNNVVDALGVSLVYKLDLFSLDQNIPCKSGRIRDLDVIKTHFVKL